MHCNTTITQVVMMRVATSQASLLSRLLRILRTVFLAAIYSLRLRTERDPRLT